MPTERIGSPRGKHRINLLLMDLYFKVSIEFGNQEPYRSRNARFLCFTEIVDFVSPHDFSYPLSLDLVVLGKLVRQNEVIKTMFVDLESKICDDSRLV